MWNIMLTKLLNNFIKHQKVQVSKHWGLSRIMFKMNSTDTNAVDINLFTSEEVDKILNIINVEDMEDLLQYSITKKHAQNLQSHRVHNGPYRSLEQLLQVKDMNEKSLYKFYKSIISNKKKDTLKKKKEVSRKIISNFIIAPKVINDSQKDVSTVLGIHTGVDIISWSLLNRNCEVLEWNYKFFSRNHTKENIHSLLQTTLSIAANIPKADRYIMLESDKIQKNWMVHQNYLEKFVRSAIIMSYLTMNSRFDIAEFVTNNIFILRQNIIQKLYGLSMGNENISTQYVLQKLLEKNERPPEGTESSFIAYIKPEFRDMYNEQSAINKEQIGWPLLIALTFIELIVHERNDIKIRNIRNTKIL